MKTRILLITLVAVALLAACKGKSGSYEFVNNNKNSGSGADTVQTSDSANNTLKLVKTAEIKFKVKDVRQTGEDIAALTNQFGGMVMHHQVESATGSTRDVHISNDSVMRIAVLSTTGEMSVKVPSAKLEDFMSKISRMGSYVNMSRMDVEDRSLDYLSSQLKLKDRQDLVAQQKTGKIIIKKPENVLALKDDMVDQQIDSRRIDEAVKFSRVDLNFYQNDIISKEIVANDDPSAYNIPLFQRIVLAFENGWSVFVDVFVGLLNLWVFIVTGIIIWRIVIYCRKKGTLNQKPIA